MNERWLPLDSPAWPATYATLHMWSQIVGKVQLALAPRTNHWWSAALHVTERGLATDLMRHANGTFSLTFDFVNHQLECVVCDGRRGAIALTPQTVADFYARVTQMLAGLNLAVKIWPMPVEVPSPVRFDRDVEHTSYDADAAQAFWRVLVDVSTVFAEFRSRFTGKATPPLFWWGSFDLAITRFSGRLAPERPGADAVTREAYSHEVLSAGFWPGGGAMTEPAFYAYAAPEPEGFKTARVQPSTAFYSADFNEFFVKYEDVRRSASPRDTLLAFLQSTYEAGATLGAWDRGALERAYV